MTPPFSVHTTPHFDRLFKKLTRQHSDLGDRYAEALEILTGDPHNLSRRHQIQKLEGMRPGEGEYRLRLGRWRFRYDIFGQAQPLARLVELKGDYSWVPRRWVSKNSPGLRMGMPRNVLSPRRW